MLGASPSSTWDHSHAWQMCDLVSRVAVVGSLCLLQGGPQVSVIAIFTSAVPVLLISVLKLPSSRVSPSIPVVPGVDIGRGLLPASWEDSCCCDVLLYLFFRSNLSLFSLSLGSCYVDISLLLSFSFIFFYSQEMYPPFQVYSCTKRTPLSFFLCMLYLMTLIDFLLSVFYLHQTRL